MDSRGRAKDNIWIERFWRTIKQEYIYLNPADNGVEPYQWAKEYMTFYNFERSHQAIGRKIPAEIYLKNAA
ncbi:MAG TPA: integrase core domain-containing protein [Candidatus Egerieousia sp.]|nr:integrase core domain-containing protein [Candidatus Egerieousia sp.]